ncbi:MAG: GDSL-type esterase/lipase family protein [Flavobacteriales bacterium]
MKKLILLFLLLSATTVAAKVHISLDDPNISYDGVFYTVITPNKVEFNRHLSSMLNDWSSGIAGQWMNQWVITQTGVRIRFKTASVTIDLKFSKRAGGGTIGTLPTTGFTVFVNGVESATFSDTTFTIVNPNAGTSNTFEVTLPNLWAVDFVGMEIDDTYSLDAISPLNKPVYVAIGNSITHGTGQYVSAAKGYPFLLAKKMDWDLHNIAVAGATLGWSIAKNIKGKQVDYITIKIGFNDWKYSTASLASKRTEYTKLLDSLRAYQPNAKIICISPLYSSDNSGAAPYSLQDFRDMVIDLVSKRMQTEDNLCLLIGTEFSDASMLAPGDPTHLSEYGASKIADALFTRINDCSYSASTKTMDNKNEKLYVIGVNASRVQLHCENQGSYNLTIFSAEGKLILSKSVNLTKGENILSLQENKLSSGLYLIKLQNQSDSCFVKLGVN